MIWYFGFWFLSLSKPLYIGVGQRTMDSDGGVESTPSLPLWCNSLALCAPLELLHGYGPNILEVVCAGVRDDGVPDDGLVGVIVGRGPLGGDVDEELLGVPCEQGREICVEGELDDGVFFLLGGVVMWAALDSVRERVLSITTSVVVNALGFGVDAGKGNR